MGRLVNGKRVIINPKPENAGKLLIFCEGYTEYNYLNYFKIYLENNLHVQYSDIVLETINTQGNAMNVYQYAERFMSMDENIKKYRLYEKHLIFDCDAPDNIQDVINMMKRSENEYVLDLSNLLFETWLVMHYRKIEIGDRCSKRDIIHLMRENLNVDRYTSKIKANPGMIGKILGDDGNKRIKQAIENAREIETYWEKNSMDISTHIKKMNPCIKIHVLIERLLEEIEYLCQ